MAVCVLGTAEDCVRARALDVPSRSLDELKAFGRNVKAVNAFLRRFDVLFASAALIRIVPRLFGPKTYCRCEKFPRLLSPNDDLHQVITLVRGLLDELSSALKLCGLYCTQTQVR
jgi:large subunit ribosomal protein L10Ae